MKNFLLKFWPIILLILLGLPALRPFLKAGLFASHDGDVYLPRSFEFFKALQDGQWPPRWAQDFNFQFGYPIFNFFYPLAFYMVSFLHFFGFSFTFSLKLLFILSFIFSGITMYFLAKEFFGKFGGILSGLFCLYAPFHAVNLYVRGSLGELLVLAFFPLLLLWFYKQKFLWSGVILGLIILSHNILALISFVWLLIFFVFLLISKKEKKSWFFGFLITIFFGLGLSSFFWLPALAEKKYTVFDTVALKEFNFRDHFVYPLQLRYSPWGFGGSQVGPIDGMSFKLGKIQVLFFLSGLLSSFFLKNKLKEKKLISYFVFMFFLATFLSLTFSQFFWENLVLLSLVQFPWRFLSFSMLAMAFLAGSLGIFFKKLPKFLFFLLCFLIVFLNLGYFQAGPGSYKNDQDLTERKLFLTNSTYADELLPLGVKEMPKALPKSKIEIKEGNGQVKDQEFKSNLIKGKIITDKPSKIEINNFYFPGWQLFVNNQKKEFDVLDPLGNIGFNLGEGEYLVELKLLSTGVEQLGNYLSVLTLLILTFYLCRKKLRF